MLQRKWTMSKGKPKAITLDNSHIEDTLCFLPFSQSNKSVLHILKLVCWAQIEHTSIGIKWL